MIVLIVISVAGMVMSAILSQAETSVQTTIALRDQASNNYGADAATNAILNALKTSGINCSDPTNPTPVTLGTVASPFYVPARSEQGSLDAYARCTPDAITGAATTTVTPMSTTTTTVTPAPITSTGSCLNCINNPDLPPYALLTTGNTANDFGTDFSVSANQKTICIENGSVGSNKDINASGQYLAVRLAGTGTSDCRTGTGVDSATGSRLVIGAEGQCIGGSGAFTPTACDAGSKDVTVPAVPSMPGDIVADNPQPVCTTVGKTTYAALLPGRYTNVNLLNNPCSGSAADWEWLKPGNFYFDYGSTSWNWPTSRLIAGTPTDSNGTPITGIDVATPSTLSKLGGVATSPGACQDPASAVGVNGVALVFAGASAVAASSSGVAEICASSPNGVPPLAIYGLPTARTVARTAGGTTTLPAETLCAQVSGCGSTSLIQTATNGQAELYVKGYVYAPQAQMILTLKNSVGQVFNWGVVLRNLRLMINGASPSQALIRLPKPNTGVGTKTTTTSPSPYPTAVVSPGAPSTSTTYTIRYVNVWTCTVASLQASGLAQCPSSGTPNVQVKVLTNGPTLTILSWNHIR